MTNKRGVQPAVVPPSVTPEIGIDLLKRLVREGDVLLNQRPISKTSKSLWENKAKDFFYRSFGSDLRNINVVLSSGNRAYTRGQSESYYENMRFEELRDEVQAVVSMIDLLQLEIDLSTSCPTCNQNYPKGQHNFCLHCGTALGKTGEDRPTSSKDSEFPTLVHGDVHIVATQIGDNADTDSFENSASDPFCARCWQVDGRKINLDRWEGLLTCPQCASTLS